MSRRYHLPSLPTPGPFELPQALVRHLAVVRARAGDELVLFDGAGKEATAVIRLIERRRVAVAVGPHHRVDREPACHVELALAVPRGTRAEWLFEHATEVGVARFRPIVFARSKDAAHAERRARWERIVIAAAEQCDRSRLPGVDAELPLAALLAAPDLPTERWVALPGATEDLSASRAPRVMLCVGPEGGLTDAEVRALAAAGFAPRSLGPLTLRTETAALVGAARLLA